MVDGRVSLVIRPGPYELPRSPSVITFHLPGPRVRTLIALALSAAAAPAARADVLITNGGFEAGLAGWTRADQLGSDGTFALPGPWASVIAARVPAPPGGTRAAMTDAQGPGS